MFSLTKVRYKTEFALQNEIITNIEGFLYTAVRSTPIAGVNFSLKPSI